MEPLIFPENQCVVCMSIDAISIHCTLWVFFHNPYPEHDHFLPLSCHFAGLCHYLTSNTFTIKVSIIILILYWELFERKSSHPEVSFSIYFPKNRKNYLYNLYLIPFKISLKMSIFLLWPRFSQKHKSHSAIMSADWPHYGASDIPSDIWLMPFICGENSTETCDTLLRVFHQKACRQPTLLSYQILLLKFTIFICNWLIFCREVFLVFKIFDSLGNFHLAALASSDNFSQHQPYFQRLPNGDSPLTTFLPHLSVGAIRKSFPFHSFNSSTILRQTHRYLLHSMSYNSYNFYA